MAEVIWNQRGADKWQAFSAGSRPAGYVHPLALKALANAGLEHEELISKNVSAFIDQPFDLVVTVCDNAQNDCPTFSGASETLHWPFDDPADAVGPEEQVEQVFFRVRDEINTKIAQYLAEDTDR